VGHRPLRRRAGTRTTTATTCELAAVAKCQNVRDAMNGRPSLSAPDVPVNGTAVVNARYLLCFKINFLI